MFAVTLIQVAVSRDEGLRSFEEEYKKRLSTFCDFSIETVNGSDAGKEGEGILKKVKPQHILILLDERGKEFTSREFAEFLGKRKDHGEKSAFIIGGAYGVSDAVKARANFTVSLSKMTFPHQLVRVFFLEQLYRAFTILAGKGYHH